MDPIVQAPDIQHIVKDIVTRDDAPVFRLCTVIFRLAAADIIIPKVRFIERRHTFRADLGGNDIQQCALSGPVSAVKKRDIVELDLLQPFLREDLKRIERIVAGPFDPMQEPFLRCL